MRSRAFISLAVLVVLASAITPASAATPASTGPPPRASAAQEEDGRWSEGSALYTLGYNCTSIIFNQPRLEQQSFVYASQLLPKRGLPHAGDVFYARVTFGSVGDICGGGGSALPDLVPPDGVEVVEDPGFPPYWSVYQGGEVNRGSDPVVVNLSPDRRRAQIAVRDLSDGETKPWTYANSGGFISVHVALRARRPLNGIGSTAPNCPERENGSACPGASAGDHLQVVTNLTGTPSVLVPYVGLFAREPAAPILRVSGRTVRVRTAPGFGVQAVARRGSRAVARLKTTASRSGAATLRFKRSRRPRSAVLEVTALADDGTSSKVTRRRIRF